MQQHSPKRTRNLRQRQQQHRDDLVHLRSNSKSSSTSSRNSSNGSRNSSRNSSGKTLKIRLWVEVSKSAFIREVGFQSASIAGKKTLSEA
ncbi:hypothetical protein ACSSS7_001247 [Eimeria intestinalis]